MRNRLATALLCGAAVLACGASAPTVRWQTVTHRLNADGKPEFVQRFIVSGDRSNLARLAFCQFDRVMTPVNPADTVGKIIPGYYYIATPRFADAGADSVVVDIVTSGVLGMYSYGADGVHGVDASGKPFDVDFARLRNNGREEQWAVPGKSRMPLGDAIYAINEGLATDYAPGAYDILPSFKSVRPGKGTYDGRRRTTKLITHENPDFYRIIVSPEGAAVEAASRPALKMASRTLDRLLAVNGGKLPAAIIEDWPDYGYRGLMIDIARNNQPLPRLKKLADIMAAYRMNRLQFHLIDDEAWRLEIPGLPELTDVGARRGYTTDEADFLAQIYSGDGNPDATTGYANGHISRADFIDFLRYCDSLGIAVIPEVETPGHARAAVKAMETRYRRTGDATYRLREDGDTSKYRSAQDFGDNVMNPALPGPYNFMNKVFDEIIAMYREAGVPLQTIHIGGDEVPHGAWSGSPSAVKFMKEHGMNSEGDLHVHWVKSMADALTKRGLRLSGWQEIALGKDEATAKGLAPQVEFVNLWVTWPDKKDDELPAVKAQKLGLPVLLSTAQGYYMDQAYEAHPDEKGMWWAMITDELKSLEAYPSKLSPTIEGGKVIGVQGQLWSETVRGPEMMEYYLFPKMLGMIERSWNSDTTLTRSEFNRIVGSRELPWLQAQGVNFRMRQPGIKIEEGKVLMNSPYPGATIRYTLDGSEPSQSSPAYSAPVDLPEGAREVRARLYSHGKESVTTILPVKAPEKE